MARLPDRSALISDAATGRNRRGRRNCATLSNPNWSNGLRCARKPASSPNERCQRRPGTASMGTRPFDHQETNQVVKRRRNMMHRWLLGLSVALTAPVALPAFAQDAVPQIPYESVPNFLKLPADIHLGEAAGVAVNSKGHVFVYSRSGSSLGPAYGNAASQLLEFDPGGKVVREIGK